MNTLRIDLVSDRAADRGQIIRSLEEQTTEKPRIWLYCYALDAVKSTGQTFKFFINNIQEL